MTLVRVVPKDEAERPDRPRTRLSKLNCRVAVLIGRGLSYPEVAAELGLGTWRTAQYHTHTVFKSLPPKPGLPTQVRVRQWATSPDGSAYLAAALVTVIGSAKLGSARVA